jgi:hypothetical protein
MKKNFIVYGHVHYTLKASVRAESEEEAMRIFEMELSLSEGCVRTTGGDGFVALNADEAE